MMPNKEQCLNAIDVIARYCSEVKQGHIPPRFELTNELDVLMQVVEEHFELKEIIKNHGLENLTLHELDCAFRKMLSYVEENNRLMNLLTQQNEIIKEYQNGEAYKELKRSYDELLGHAVAFQEELINLKDNPPLKFEELHDGMWVWVNDMKIYRQVHRTYVREVDDFGIEIEMVQVGGLHLGFEPNRFYRKEVKHD